MILSTLIFGCAAALVAGQTASNPAVRTDGGQLVLLSSEDVLIEDTAPGSVRGDRIGLLASMRAMASEHREPSGQPRYSSFAPVATCLASGFPGAVDPRLGVDASARGLNLRKSVAILDLENRSTVGRGQQNQTRWG